VRLILLGPPGAGKGTQAAVLSKDYSMPHISTGQILREAVEKKTSTGNTAKGFMDKGELVPDEIVSKMVAERLAEKDTKNGFILDGFPRNKNQAIQLDEQLKIINVKIDFVLYFKTSETTAIKRLTGRRVCPKCGLNYHTVNRPPKHDNACDMCRTLLIQRLDDNEETIRNRFKVYQDQTTPLLDYYSQTGYFKEICGDLGVNGLNKKLEELFKAEHIT